MCQAIFCREGGPALSIISRNTVTFGAGCPCFPYEPIGPFTMSSQPRVGLYSTIAAATTFSAIIAEMPKGKQ